MKISIGYLSLIVFLLSCREYKIENDIIEPKDQNNIVIGNTQYSIYDGSIGNPSYDINGFKNNTFLIFSAVNLRKNIETKKLQKNVETKLLLKGYADSNLNFHITELRKDSLINDKSKILSTNYIAKQTLKFIRNSKIIEVTGTVQDTLNKKVYNFSLKKSL